MLENKKVSAIIPFYSHVEWLKDAVESVLQQTYKNIEIIVVNDGSKENVEDFLKQYGEYIHYYYQNNAGPAAARNFAIEKSTGDYIAFLDSDDLWLPEKTAKQVRFMEEKNVMWSNTGFLYWYPDEQIIKKIDVKDNYDDVYLQSLLSLRISTPSVMVNRDCLVGHDALTFDTNMRFGQDSILFQNLSNKYPLGLLQEPLMKVRIRGNNTYTRADVRILFKSKAYHILKKRPITKYSFHVKNIIRIYKIYVLEEKIFTFLKKIKIPTLLLDFIGKILWAFPYILERVYVRYIVLRYHKNSFYKL